MLDFIDSSLHIPAGMRSDTPIIHTVSTKAELCITIEEDAQATVAIWVQAACTLEIIVQKNASLTLFCIQDGVGDVSQTSQIAEAASIKMHTVSLASHISHSVETRLEGRDARSDIDWIFYATDTENYSISAKNIFLAENGSGEITLKGVAEGKAHVRCDGLIAIGLGGGGTDTYLTEDVLLLDDTTKVDAIPGLEIKTNDVKASHSATMSKVTLEDLLYFQSRGIDEKTARHMFIEGFLSDLTGRITNTEIREQILERITKKFHA